MPLTKKLLRAKLGKFNEWSKNINWGMVEAIATIFIMIFAIVAVYYAVDAEKKNREFLTKI